MLVEQRLAATWVLGLLTALTVSWMLILVRGWQTNRLLIDRRQLAARLLGLVALVGIWVLLGCMLLYLDPRTQVRALLLCFGGTLALTLLLAVVALVDWRLLRLQRLAREARLELEVSRSCARLGRGEMT